MTAQPILKPCPCGQTPSKLHISDTGQGGKYADVFGDCCGDWKIEFRQQYTTGDEAMGLAITAWNIATRRPYDN
jgi:hypothetical protein